MYKVPEDCWDGAAVEAESSHMRLTTTGSDDSFWAERLVRRLLAETAARDSHDIHLGDRLDAYLGDSLDVVELVMTVEERVGVSIADEVAVQLRTVQDLVDAVRQGHRPLDS